MPGKQRKNKPDEAGQLEAARIIVAEPLRYPGVIQDWAKLVLQKHKQVDSVRKSNTTR